MTDNEKFRLEGADLDEWMRKFMTPAKGKFKRFDELPEYKSMSDDEIRAASMKNITFNIIGREDFEKSMMKVIEESIND